jgi:YidC/Oxa1 family membrane protein insertase
MDILTEVFLRPMLNFLLLLYGWTGNNFGIAIIVFTILIRLVILPLTLQQLHQSKKMSSLSPKLNAIRQKYKNDSQKVSQETMALYREAGVNPIGCLGPMVIQFPIWIALYSAIYQVVPSNAGRVVPEGILHLSGLLYPFVPQVYAAIPLNHVFLGLDLVEVGTAASYVLAVVVGATMWMQQKMAINPDTVDPQSAQMNRTMLTIMPLMFAFFTISVSPGLALYWLVSNIISIILQYFVTGWGSLRDFRPLDSFGGLFRRPQPAAAVRKVAAATSAPALNGASDSDDDNAPSARSRRRTNARSRSKRQNR